LLHYTNTMGGNAGETKDPTAAAEPPDDDMDDGSGVADHVEAGTGNLNDDDDIEVDVGSVKEDVEVGDDDDVAAAAAESKKKKKSEGAAPPTVITVDTSIKTEQEVEDSSGKAGSGGGSVKSHANGATTTSDAAASQARTPKHANKNPDDAAAKVKEEEDDAAAAATEQLRHPPAEGSPHHHPPGTGHAAAYGSGGGSYSHPPRPFDGRLGGSGAFQPHERQQQQHPPPPYPHHQQNRMPPMQVSPGSGRYYGGGGYGSGPNRFGPPPSHPQYDQYGAGAAGPNYQQRPYGGGHGMYPQQYQQAGYDGAGPSWGVPPAYAHGRPPAYPSGHPPMPPQQPQQQEYATQQLQQQQQQQPHNGQANRDADNTFSRAVSSSFDRSVKSREDGGKTKGMDVSPSLDPAQPPGDNSVSGDVSWGQLNQVASVDEDEMRKRLSKRDSAAEEEKDLKVAASNSSSLTNSPTEGVEGKKPPPKAHSSLDSLSSVASAQAAANKESGSERKTFSPNDGSHSSLDLMKCASGSSALLLPTHQRHDSQFSFGHDHLGSTKRSHDEEERGDADTDHMDGTEIRKAPSDEVAGQRPKKKGRVGDKDTKKSSPLSIECSPPTSPSADARKVDAKGKQPQQMFGQEPTSVDSFYDKPPSYTYSLDSAPHMPRDPAAAAAANAVAPRPGSSSSTITPMNVDATAGGAGLDHRQPPGVGAIPSWEIQAQDSFGAGSTHANGGPLISSFSFTQDYPMLGTSASVDQGVPHSANAGGGHHHGQHHPLESRNQSFEGPHYHRSDSMMSYEGQPSFDGQHRGAGGGYHGTFPPHAPSWGSASSFPQAHGYQYQSYPPTMMRNYSEDSGARGSPPPGQHGMRVMQRGFQPPPEFRAPPSMVSKGAPQPQHIISSPYGGKGGSYGWTKGEDIRLTEIMKKYKNPRDWEPIAKEHNCGRSAKECHERWIRYLKPGVRKGQWTDHEDAIVMEVVTSSSEQPFNRWSDLAQRLPGRVGKQIRDRWVNHLNPNINHLPFSRDDDLLLWEGHKKMGKRWVEISTKYFNCSRSENHIKNRWYSASFKKFITNEFGAEAYSGGKATNKKDSPKKKKDKVSPSKRQGPADEPTKMEAV